MRSNSSERIRFKIFWPPATQKKMSLLSASASLSRNQEPEIRKSDLDLAITPPPSLVSSAIFSLFEIAQNHANRHRIFLYLMFKIFFFRARFSFHKCLCQSKTNKMQPILDLERIDFHESHSRDSSLSFVQLQNKRHQPVQRSTKSIPRS